MKKKKLHTAFNSTPLQTITDDSPRPTFGLGLMGGGSWGAFTAGVLEILLPALESVGQIKVISGTSAGAVNAAAATSGLNDKGAHEAVRRINNVWNKIKKAGISSNLSDFLPVNVNDFLPKEDRWPNLPRSSINLMSHFRKANPFIPSTVSKYISNVINSVVPNWDSVQNGRVKCAVNTVQQHFLTREKKHLILTGKDLTPDGVAASASLEEFGFFQIRDRGRWDDFQYIYLDGGYAENPAIAPLLDESPTDIFMIILHDHNSKAISAQDMAHKIYKEEIHTDMAHLSLNDANLTRIHTIQIEMEHGQINNWHMNDSSKLNSDPAFINELMAAGRKSARKWLKQNGHNLGIQSTYIPHTQVLEQLSGHGYGF